MNKRPLTTMTSMDHNFCVSVRTSTCQNFHVSWSPCTMIPLNYALCFPCTVISVQFHLYTAWCPCFMSAVFHDSTLACTIIYALHDFHILQFLYILTSMLYNVINQDFCSSWLMCIRISAFIILMHYVPYTTVSGYFHDSWLWGIITSVHDCSSC